MTTPIYKPVRDGAHVHAGVVMAVDKNSLGLAKKGPKLKMDIHQLPENWRLCEAVANEEAMAVPVEDIERLLRSYDEVQSTLDAHLLVRRVQRWLDTLPKESKLVESNAD